MFIALCITIVFFASGGARADYSASTGTQVLSFCEQLDIQEKTESDRLSRLTTTINSYVSFITFGKETTVSAWEFAWALQLYWVTAENLRVLAYARGAYCYNPVLPSNLLK